MTNWNEIVKEELKKQGFTGTYRNQLHMDSVVHAWEITGLENISFSMIIYPVGQGWVLHATSSRDQLSEWKSFARLCLSIQEKAKSGGKGELILSGDIQDFINGSSLVLSVKCFLQNKFSSKLRIFA